MLRLSFTGGCFGVGGLVSSSATQAMARAPLATSEAMSRPREAGGAGGVGAYFLGSAAARGLGAWAGSGCFGGSGGTGAWAAGGAEVWLALHARSPSRAGLRPPSVLRYESQAATTARCTLAAA